MSTPGRPRQRPPFPGLPWDPADEPLRRWERLVERQIREAQDQGQFDDLPYRDQRLPDVDDAAAGEWASAFRLMRNHGVAPSWIAADKEARRLLAERDRLLARAARTGPIMRSRLRTEFAQLIDAYNTAVLQLNNDAPTLAQHRPLVDRRAQLAALEQIWTTVDDEARRPPRPPLR